MGLRDHEQRELAEIEQRLTEDDPRFAARLGKGTPSFLRTSRRLPKALGVLVVYVIGLAVVMAGLTWSSVVLIVLGGVTTTGAFIALCRPALWKRRR